jgi:hypothetical protein
VKTCIQVWSEDNSTTHVKALCCGKGLSVVESLQGCKSVEITLHQSSDFHEEFPPLETWSVGSPDGVECRVGTVECIINIGGETFGDLGEDFSGGGVVDAEGGLASVTTQMGDANASRKGKGDEDEYD